MIKTKNERTIKNISEPKADYMGKEERQERQIQLTGKIAWNEIKDNRDITLINICSCRKILGTSSFHNPLSRAPGREGIGEETRSVRVSRGASQVALVVKNPPTNAEDVRLQFDPWVGKISWRRAWQPTPVFVPGESHAQRNLMGYSPWGCKESDTTEVTQHAHMQGVQTSLHLSHSQQMIPRLDKKHHAEETQIVTSCEDSLEELTRLTHSCTCGYGFLEREATKHSQHWE